MKKGQQFWLNTWQVGHIPFHQSEINQDLLKFWPDLSIERGSKVLVPLCGKSLDMLWLSTQQYQVIGIELCEQAVVAFLQEHQLTYTVECVAGVLCYKAANLILWVGDIFTLDSSLVPAIDAIYDRASLIALPQKLRPLYVERCLGWLKPLGRILLKTIANEQDIACGPPYSVSEEEVRCLYNSNDISSLKLVQHSHRQSEDQKRKKRLVQEDQVWIIQK